MTVITCNITHSTSEEKLWVYFRIGAFAGGRQDSCLSMQAYGNILQTIPCPACSTKASMVSVSRSPTLGNRWLPAAGSWIGKACN